MARPDGPPPPAAPQEDAAETYGLRWPGRERARALAAVKPTGSLRAEPRRSLRFDDARLAVVEGDNLEVLRLLQPAYAGRVQLVFLDPPYNTGRDFVYEDHFREPLHAYLDRTGQRRGSAAPETAGRLHARWLSMMYPRLLLARRLLRPGGFCVATIDDFEAANLRLLMDDVFGGDGFVANVVWQKAYVANQTARHVSSTHDHVLVYACDPKAARAGRLPRSERQLSAFRNPDDDPRGPWKAENLSAGKPYTRGTYTIVTPAGREVRPPPGRWWRCSRERYEAWLAEGRIWFGRDGTGRPMLKKYLSEVRDGLTPSTWWPHEACGSNKEASTELKALFDGRAVFDTPKPVRLLRRIVDLFCPDGGPVVDLFAGAGTTGQAVLEACRDDGRDRPTVLVQLPEPTGGDDLPDLAAVCRERLRRVAGSGEGFRAFTLVHGGPVEPWPLADGLPLHGPRPAPEPARADGSDAPCSDAAASDTERPALDPAEA